MRLIAVLGGLAAVACALAAPAYANIIQIGSTGATLTCSVSCQGFTLAGGVNSGGPHDDADPTGQGSLSAALAQLYNGSPASAVAGAQRLDILDDGVDNNSTSCTGFCVDPAGSLDGNGQLTSAAAYLVLKLGAHSVFIFNTSGGSQTYTYAENGATGLGFSGYRELNGAVVPIPAAMWLMIAGVAGLGFASRRKRPL
jgi:hypothetical protein